MPKALAMKIVGAVLNDLPAFTAYIPMLCVIPFQVKMAAPFGLGTAWA